MGAIAQQTQGRQLQKANPKGELRAILERNWPRIQSVIGNNMSPERLLQMCISEINRTPHLAECSAESVLSCFMKCSALGLEPSSVNGLGGCYVIPFRNHGKYEATFVLGYKGMIDLARRSGEIRDISARAVHEGDEFHYSYGLHEDLVHVPCANPGKLTHVYMVANFKDGGHYFQVMNRADIDKARASSKASGNGPWVTHYEEMARKTVIRRAFPYLPVSVDARSAGVADETTPDYSDIFNPVIDDEPESTEQERIDMQNAPADAHSDVYVTDVTEDNDTDRLAPMYEGFARVGVTDPTGIQGAVQQIVGRPVADPNELTDEEVAKVVADLDNAIKEDK